jgi:hypothetical protein
MFYCAQTGYKAPRRNGGFMISTANPCRAVILKYIYQVHFF